MDDSERLTQAARTVAAAGSAEGTALSAPRFDDPLTDAYSLAAHCIDQQVIQPHPQVERQLPASQAIETASGLLTSASSASSPLAGGRRWWRRLWGPAVIIDPATATDNPAADAVTPDAVTPAAVVPSATGGRIIEPVSRKSQPRGFQVPAGLTAAVLAEDLPPSSSWLGLMRWSLRNRQRQVTMLVVLSAIGGLAGLSLPLATAALFSYAVPAGDINQAVAILAAFALASIGAGVLLFARNLTLIGLRDESGVRLANGIMARLLRLPTGFFRERSQGDILTRSMCAEEARVAVDDGVPSVILTAAFGAVNLAFLLVLDPWLGLALTALVAVIVTITVRAQWRARDSLDDWLAGKRAADARLMSAIQAIVPIRSRGAESRAMVWLAGYQAKALAAFNTRMRLRFDSAVLTGFGPLLVSVVLVTMVIVAGSSFQPNSFLPIYTAVLQLAVAMTLFSTNIVVLSEIGPVLAQAVPIAEANLERPAEHRHPGPLHGEITLTDVVFGYDPDAPPLLNGVSLRIEPGEFVAIVGASGSGKSTLLRLILGFEQPQSGVVAFDGQDLAGLDPAAVRRQIGTVLQSSLPYGDTFRECICGPLHIDDAEVFEVLERAGLAAEVRARPEGLDAPLTAGGGSISGGQMQRLMIARALASKPRIMVLDEATSALDNITQEVVMRAIVGLDVTRVAIAHRLTTVEQADRVLVVDSGRIVEEGAPAELLRRGGHYAALAARQEL